MINSIYVIQSHPSEGSTNCTSSGDQITCCDVTNYERFDFPVNFIFGVTESAQGNTAGATLLGYHEATYPQRLVGTMQVTKDSSLILSVGSTFAIPSGPMFPILRGFRMLWFVIGKHPTVVLQ